MPRLGVFLIVLYGCITLLILSAQALNKKSIKFTLKELRSILLKSLAYGSVMIIAAYLYYFFGIKTE